MNKEEIIEILKSVEDPELKIDIYTLGLIYDLKINEMDVNIQMTLTSPMCPFGPQIMEEVATKIKAIGAKLKLDLTFDPPWKPSDELREILGVWAYKIDLLEN